MLNAIKTGTKVPRVEVIARRIEQDIKASGLEPGDKYKTSLQVARSLKIGNEIANRAMQLLAQRNVIERRHRAGTFVATGMADIDAPALNTIHLVVEKQNVDTYGVLRDGAIAGLHSVLPGTDIRFSFIPATGHEEFIDNLLANAFSSGVTNGFILYRSDEQIQQAVAQSGLPAAISGSRWPGIMNIPCCVADHHSAGKQLAENLIRKGHRKIAFFTRDNMFMSDHELLDGIREAMAQAGCSLSDLTFRSLPLKNFVIQGAARGILQQPEPPTGFICREEILAHNVSQVLGTKEGVVMSDFFEAPRKAAKFPYIRSLMKPEEQGAILGEMLTEMAKKPAEIPNDCVKEVELVEV
ncbi:histidine utilization repressor [Anaerohalosphaera lusitana]|uniref:Histidine utilization repressor n=1 Tax=Anaerohalosphaera lusitana TaxID=1936003 RepID=A0A1U9NJS0_9BACT|nr:GntR family transcriptional regulator [Anaerohalosphaera lusitana]AQT68183.1 histidine utilization repressor [Anaerohalosphaera lusitana]